MKNVRKHKLPLAIIIIIVIAAFLLLYMFVMKAPTTAPSETKMSLRETLLTDATVTIPELDPVTTVKLTGQTTEFSVPGSVEGAPGGTVTVVGEAVGDQNTLYSIVAVNTGGSGEFFYLMAFEDSPDGYISKGSTPLGDRIQVQNLAFTAPNTLTVSYLMHGPDQAMVDAPNVSVTDVYTYENDVFTHTSQN